MTVWRSPDEHRWSTDAICNGCGREVSRAYLYAIGEANARAFERNVGRRGTPVRWSVDATLPVGWVALDDERHACGLACVIRLETAARDAAGEGG